MNLYNRYSDEKELVNALIAGNENAYRQVINEYRAPVIRLCRGYTGSTEDAEDLAQDIFIEIFNSIGKFKARSSLSTWIYRIAVNKSLNYIRKRKKMKYGVGGTVDEFNEDDSESVSPETGMVRKEHAIALHNAIDNLPPAQRTAFILSKYEDLKYNEIAEIMKTSVSSVESLLFRAKRNLQDSLQYYYKKNMS